MPDLSAVGDLLLPATVFLYPTLEDAKAGAAYGGSGVVVGLPHDDRPDLYAMYVVSNWHVACVGGHSIIRYTSTSGNTCFVETDPSEWDFIPGGPDVAACRFRPQPGQLPFIITETMLPEKDDEFFVGEDVFMVGRFVDFDGKDTNRPALRFGAVSMLNAQIRQPTGSRSPSHIVDLHSRTGFSGSPVYAYRDGLVSGGTSLLNGPSQETRRTWGGSGLKVAVKLLGIQWGQFAEQWELKEAAPRPESEASLVTEGQYVRGFSGMSCVVPVSQIRALLERPMLRASREEPTHFKFAAPEVSPDLGTAG